MKSSTIGKVGPMIRKMTILVVLLACALALLATGALADNPGNDDFDNAEEVPTGVLQSGWVSEPDPSDWYKFSVDVDDNIVVEAMTNRSEGLHFTLYDPSRVQLFWTHIDKPGEIERFNWLTSLASGPQSFFLSIAGTNFTMGTAAYEFNISLTDMVDIENNDDRAEAIVIREGNFPGDVLDPDTDDWYMFKAGKGDVINLTFNAWSKTDDMYLEMFRGSVLTRLRSKGGTQVEYSFCTNNHTRIDWFYLHVGRLGDGGTYNFSITLSFQSDARSEWDAGRGMDPSIGFELGVWEKGYVKDWDTEDWYRFYVPSGWGAVIRFKSAAVDYERMCVHYYTGNIPPGSNGTGYETINLTSKDWAVDSVHLMTHSGIEGNYWYLEAVMETSDTTLGHRYEFKVLVGDQLDGGVTGDAGSTQVDFRDVQAGTTYSGWIGDMDDVDMYRIVLAKASVLNLSFEQIAGQVELALINDGEAVWNATSADDHWWEASVLTSSDTAMAWFLMISTNGGPRSYNFTFTVTPQDDAGSGNDVRGDCSGAYGIAAGRHTGRVGSLDLEDWYEFDVSELLAVKIEATWEVGTDLQVQVYDACDGTILDSMNGTAGDTITLELVVPRGWTDGDPLYLRVSSDPVLPHGVYQLTLTISSEPVDVDPPVVDHTPPGTAKEHKDLVINATVVDDDDNVTVTLYYRMNGTTEWKTVDMTGDAGDNYVGTIPKEDLEDGTLEYYIEATDSEGNTEVVQSGSTPINIEVKKKPKPDDSPGLGVLLALGGLGLAAATTRRRRA
jgi:hypothetical protein